tara:strand:+ start:1276 stop:1401 length:126 start_codon:yes stop_codon:yes gene_type:complete
MNEQHKDFWSAVGIAVFFILFTLLLLSACDSGWSIAGWEVK